MHRCGLTRSKCFGAGEEEGRSRGDGSVFLPPRPRRRRSSWSRGLESVEDSVCDAGRRRMFVGK